MSGRGGVKLHHVLRSQGLLSASAAARLLGIEPGDVKRIGEPYLPVVWIEWKGTRRRTYRQRDVQEYAAVLSNLRGRHANHG